jgi:hypothetical protein
MAADDRIVAFQLVLASGLGTVVGDQKVHVRETLEMGRRQKETARLRNN